MASQPLIKLTEEKYLELERGYEFRSEFVDGEMLAMSGGTGPHSLLSSTLIAQFLAHGCKAFTSDRRVRTGGGAYLYPDVSVVCGKCEFWDKKIDTLLNPV